MEEKVLSKKKNGMAALFCIMVLYAVSVAGILFGMRNAYIEFIIGGIFVAGAATILIAGLKVLKPQEALVLTLFGKYVGTLKEDGFYFVNPFCTSVNPAARTKLNQSGDVNDSAALMAIANKTAGTAIEAGSNKISLKIMTLNNNKQKINDCLGNPIEIGIAVTWKVVDTAKAVFNVDNYKEFLSLQCDSALRDIPMMWRRTSIRQETDFQMREVCAAQVRLLRAESATRYKKGSRRQESRLLRRALHILPTRRKSQQSCFSASRHPQLLMRGK